MSDYTEWLCKADDYVVRFTGLSIENHKSLKDFDWEHYFNEGIRYSQVARAFLLLTGHEG